MRLRIRASTLHPGFIPINYQYQLHSMFYNLMRKSSREYASFLHDKGYSHREGSAKSFKFFTFSKLDFKPYCFTGNGFEKIRQIECVFSTIIHQNFNHIINGLFIDYAFSMRFLKNAVQFVIDRVESLPEPEFLPEMSFFCLSPITVTTVRNIKDESKTELHFLDYMKSAEREPFCQHIYKNLVTKYEAIHQSVYQPSGVPFRFEFSDDYIQKRKGRISKLIQFKDGVVIKAFEAPFRIQADPELMKIGYQCGFGEKNSAGFGCVEVAREENRVTTEGTECTENFR